MGKRLSVLIGTALFFMGAIALASNAAVHLLGQDLWRLPWRFWPLAVVVLGLLFMVAPFLTPKRRDLGTLFVPGMPLLVTGFTLLFTSVFDIWDAWRWLWPLEVLSVALGLVSAALYTRALWLVIPGIVVGANALLFQFCAITGWWNAWSILWAIEPLSLGLALLMFGFNKRSMGLLVVAATMLGAGGLGLIGATALVSLRTVWSGAWLLDLVGPLAIMAAGSLLLILSLLHRSMPAKMAG